MEPESFSYSYTNEAGEYPTSFYETIYKSLLFGREYFVGLCSLCYNSKGSNGRLLRCSGCQLLAYCSKQCQKTDWKFHKPICKQFALKNGQNVLTAVDKIKRNDQDKLIDELKGKAMQVGTAQYNEEIMIVSFLRYLQGMFDWGRMCNICKEARTDYLTDCICHCVSYCSEKHRLADKDHKEICLDLLVYARSIAYLFKNHSDLNLPINSDVDKKYHQLKIMDFNVSSLKDEWLDAKLSILSERLSFPLTTLYAMQESGLGTNKTPVESVSSLNIHVVSPMPTIDPTMWEMLVHRLPLLNELNLTFLSWNLALSNHMNIDIQTKLERCRDCKSRKRLITYNLHKVHYHMHFSSDDYIEPDVIAVFGCRSMTMSEEDMVHAVTSFRNMTYDEDTLILLTDSDNEKILKSIRDVNEARPVDVIMPARENPFRGFSSIRGESQTNAIVNSREWMACVRRK